ncbi:hypothetical protein EDB86DRAFT_2794603 [Lactarius hatsudake]|nr:hypothetical protein EDB86DRAFT_2794603 [Lactarius hatsudake]
MKPASSLGAPSRPKHTGLSNLSLALEKLKAPPPSRPATTLGFTRDTDSVIGTSKPTPKAMDDSTVRLGNGLPLSARMAATPLKRAASVGSAASLQPNAHASGSKTTTVITRPSNLPPAAGPPRGFVYGGVGKRRPFEKVSKKSSLPVVEASPVKGSESSRVVNGNPGELPLLSVGHMLPPSSPMKLQEVFTRNIGVPKADEKMVGDLADAGEAELPDVWKDASRRASLASQFLQQTLAVLPATPPPGGSKSTAVVRPQSSSQGTRSGLRSSSGLDVAGSRSASGAPSNSPGVRTHIPHSGTTAGAPSTTKPSSLKVLKSCTIFVDVRTDDGDDAGGLFVDMLRGLGAKIIGRAGQSCTHIVYKNGLMSTLTKYRLMREPKPLVVGISWVVECTEQRRRVEENDFIVDLEGLNIAGNNKRRRSMLPRHISSNIQSHTMAAPSQPSSSLVGADHSLHSSDGFVEDEDDLPPLERARQRRNIFFKR